MITDINSEDRLVQKTFANHLHDHLGWESVYAYNTETFGPKGTLGRKSEREAVLVRDLRAALARLNPMRMDCYKTYQEIIADYNREKDRITVEETFARLMDLASRLDAEERRAAEEGLSDDELALFDLLFKERISKTDRERLKQASKALLASLEDLLRPIPGWTQNTNTQAEVKVFILDSLWRSLPRPPFNDEETESVADRVYDYVLQRSVGGHAFMAA